ncbi:MAG TPA: enoyl-CoA hydratase/isomerase family protein [Dehalococcoidia bacterium]|nr:enoyl-CoA hydratase/isomerase family protein [Dehalococcoidia bacterium]
MAYKEIIYTVEDYIATIILNRPESLNAFTDTLLTEWVDAIETAKTDPKVRVVIVTGAGRGFCSGMDVKAAAGGGRQGQPVYARRNYMRLGVHRVPRALESLDKPYIAAINGPAAGAGMDMASMADIRIMSDKARVGMNYVRMGLLPGDAGCYFLPRIVGIAKALELIWSGRMIDAEEALSIGYVTKVVPHEELMSTTKEFCRQFTQAPVATQFAKKLLWRGLDQFRNLNLEMAEMAMLINSTTPDTQEGPRAWVEKREPQWSGE